MFQKFVPTSFFVLICGVLSVGGQVRGDWSIRGVAFSVGRLTVSNDSRVDIFVNDGSQKKARRVAEGSDPDWSPDGSKIVFASIGDRGGKSEIYTINLDGSAKKQLTQKKGGTGAGMPAWSPDGKRIAFTVPGPDLHKAGIYVMDDDGSNPQFATEGLSPQWSPDGHRLAFYRVAKSHRDKSSIWVANSDGTKAKQITDENSMSWLPDGRRMARSYLHLIAAVGPPSIL